MYQKRAKKTIKSSREEYLLGSLVRVYSPEKTMDDYDIFLQTKTYDRDLIDKVLKEWEKRLYDNDTATNI